MLLHLLEGNYAYVEGADQVSDWKKCDNNFCLVLSEPEKEREIVQPLIQKEGIYEVDCERLCFPEARTEVLIILFSITSMISLNC